VPCIPIAIIVITAERFYDGPDKRPFSYDYFPPFFIFPLSKQKGQAQAPPMHLNKNTPLAQSRLKFYARWQIQSWLAGVERPTVQFSRATS